MGWEESWLLVRNTFAYTNHTLLPEALETWSEDLFARVLPRHLQLVREINRRFQEEVRTSFPTMMRGFRECLLSKMGRFVSVFLSAGLSDRSTQLQLHETSKKNDCFVILLKLILRSI